MSDKAQMPSNVFSFTDCIFMCTAYASTTKSVTRKDPKNRP